MKGLPLVADFTEEEFDDLSSDEQEEIMLADPAIVDKPLMEWDRYDWCDLPEGVQEKLMDNSIDSVVGHSIADIEAIIGDIDDFPEEYRDRIILGDPENAELAAWLEKLAQSLVDHYNKVDESWVATLAESDWEYALSYPEELVQDAQRFEEVGSMRDRFSSIDDERFEEALGEALSDINNYPSEKWEIGFYSYCRSNTLIHFGVSDRIFYPFNGKEWDKLKEMSDDLIKLVVNDLDDPDLIVRAEDFIGARDSRGPIERWIDDPVWEISANPDWSLVEDDLVNQFGEPEEEEEEEDDEDVGPPAERVLHVFPDGAYIQELLPSEIPPEGRAMRHCLGGKEYGPGYIRAVRRKEIKIISIRTAAGRPKMTMEVAIDEDGKPVRVKQISGKSNRLPGWDLHKVGVGKVKEDEVDKAIKAVEVLGLDPWEVDDLKPALEAMFNGRRSNNYEPELTFDMPYQKESYQ